MSIAEVTSPDTLTKALSQKIQQEHYCLLKNIIKTWNLSSSDWQTFQDSWKNLPKDNYMADGGCYRFRRFQVFSSDSKNPELRINPDQPHYQSSTYNPLNGDVYRYYEPFLKTTLNNSIFQTLMDQIIRVFNSFYQDVRWHVEAHQFRVVADQYQLGYPTPEGLHRDGRTYLFILLVNKANVFGGETTLYHDDGTLLEKSVLDIGDAIFLDDRILKHAVTPIASEDQQSPAYRDTLVITFDVL
ncbi:MAG: 2OG-Fe dioxygenase family protein [Proteobacteria bacterium]|nr:2OG-Fe dioxygenase family protein [Pseudomonadota bacterium]